MRVDSLTFRVTPLDGGAVLARPRALDCRTAGEIRERLLILLNRGARNVVLDVSDRNVCACCGVPAIVRAHRRARALGGGLVVVMPEGSPARAALEEACLYEPESLPVRSEAPTAPLSAA